MNYAIRHLTRFVYTAPVSESVMELRMQPLERDRQRCRRFEVSVSQRVRVFAYRDHFGNAVHYFNMPGRHAKLDVTTESAVEITDPPDWPVSLPAEAWAELDALHAKGDHLDWLLPSPFATPTPLLHQFGTDVGFDRRDDPLTALHRLSEAIYTRFAYRPQTTRVDSLIDEALLARAGVCQDFSHIMTALVRGLGIPCRYVSGYLAPRKAHSDRSPDTATHAWVEAFLPRLGWVGFDPTNHTMAGSHHIAVAVGRDYSDVPPTRGVFKGTAGSELSVAVSVALDDEPMPARDLAPSVSWVVPPPSATPVDQDGARQQQQQQQ